MSLAVSESIREAVVGPATDEQLAQQKFEQGEAAFERASDIKGEGRRKAFHKAAKQFSDAAKRAEEFPIEEDALMMKAESHFFADEYVKASDAFDDLIKRYPTTRHMDRIDQRRFEIAKYWLNLRKEGWSKWLPELQQGRRPVTDTFGYATKMLDKIRFDDPTGKLADDATMKAAIANFERGKYGAADILFTDIRDNFPSSEHVFEAYLLGLKCKQLMYAGPDYDGGVLDEAEKMIKEMMLYPDKVEPHREYLLKVHKDVRLKKANREFSTAKFYDNRKEYRAARLYYAQVAKEFADTSLAEKAKSRLAEIGELPDAPPQSLEWLANMFPEENKAKPLFRR